RLQKLFHRQVARGAELPQISGEELASVFLIANLAEPPLDMGASRRLLGLFRYPAVNQALQRNAATRQLAGKWLESKCDEAQLAPEVARASTILGCDAIVHEKLRPIMSHMIEEAAANPTNPTLVSDAILLAHQLGMRDTLERKLRPAVRKA